MQHPKAVLRSCPSEGTRQLLTCTLRQASVALLVFSCSPPVYWPICRGFPIYGEQEMHLEGKQINTTRTMKE